MHDDRVVTAGQCTNVFTKSSIASQPVHKSSLELAYKLVPEPTLLSRLVLLLPCYACSQQLHKLQTNKQLMQSYCHLKKQMLSQLTQEDQMLIG